MRTHDHAQPHPADARILVVDDNEDILHAARLLLKRHFASVQTLNDPAQLAGAGPAAQLRRAAAGHEFQPRRR